MQKIVYILTSCRCTCLNSFLFFSNRFFSHARYSISHTGQCLIFLLSSSTSSYVISSNFSTLHRAAKAKVSKVFIFFFFSVQLYLTLLISLLFECYNEQLTLHGTLPFILTALNSFSGPPLPSFAYK